jgi:hypothetical protein
MAHLRRHARVGAAASTLGPSPSVANQAGSLSPALQLRPSPWVQGREADLTMKEQALYCHNGNWSGFRQSKPDPSRRT